MTTIAWDTETKGFGWFDPSEQAFLASWADADGEYVADLSDPEQVQRFTNALDSADRLVAHNLPFDVHQTRATIGYDIRRSGKSLWDTDIMSRVLYPRGAGGADSHKLKVLAQTYIDPKATEAEDHIKEMAKAIGTSLKKPGGYYDVWRAYPEVMERYAALDARYTYDLFQKFYNELDGANDTIYQLEREVATVLIDAEETGVRVDQEVVSELKREYELLAEQAQEELHAILGADAIGGKGSEEALLDSLLAIGVPLYRKTEKSGKIATNKFALQEFEDDFPILRTLEEWRQYTKFLSTYIEPMIGREYVHASFNQCGAWTSRMSCARPNMQNIPKRAGKEVRAMFIPRENHSFVVCDYDSIEVRLLAYYMADPGYKKLIKDGHDPHAWMAAQIHGGEMADYAKGTPGQEQRDIAKHTMFAITYGAGAPRVSDMNKISKAQAKTLIAQIKNSLGGYHKLNKRLRRKVESVGYVNTIIGRKQPVKAEKSYVALNALIQGSAAEIMKIGAVNVVEANKNTGGQLLLVVHDEGLVETPTEHAEEALQVTKQAMKDAYALDPELKVTGSIVTTSYADA